MKANRKTRAHSNTGKKKAITSPGLPHRAKTGKPFKTGASVLEQVPALRRAAEIARWKKYLDWKERLLRHSLSGIGYIHYDYVIAEKGAVGIGFVAVSHSENDIRHFIRTCMDNEICAIPRQMSRHPYVFECDFEFITKEEENFTPLIFSRAGEIRMASDILQGRKRYANSDLTDFINRNRELIESVQGEYSSDLYLVRLEFEIPDYISTSPAGHAVRFRKPGMGSMKEIPFAGFLMTSLSGDIAVLRRMRKAITDFQNNKAASNTIGNWLFSISEAEDPPKNYPEQVLFQNKKLNSQQKEAVRTILRSPDVCLIQGPPGTGKTTVIAEAIYQFTNKGQRVLVASQSNLAVDNALERIIDDPMIRAIRLTGNYRNTASSLSKVSEENVLSTFYGSIASHIRNKVLPVFEGTEESHFEKDLDTISEISKRISSYGTISGAVEKMEKLQKEIEHCSNGKLVQPALTAISENNTEVILPPFPDSVCRRLVNAIMPVISVYNRKICVFIGEKGYACLLQKNRKMYQQCLEIILRKTLGIIKVVTALKEDYEAYVIAEQNNNESALKRLLTGKVEIRQDVLVDWVRKYGYRMECPCGINKELFIRYPDRLFRELDTLLSKLNFIKSEFQKVLNMNLFPSDGIDRLENRLKDMEDYFNGGAASKDMEKLEALSSVYGCAPDCDEIRNAIEKNKSSAAVKLRMSGWESLCRRTLEKINKEDDFSYERNSFFRTYVNACNVVGVSCTERSSTLDAVDCESFDVVIIDEVSKATPPELLIPMLKGRKIVLVGDHKQLPPIFKERSYGELMEKNDETGNKEPLITEKEFLRYRDMVTSSIFEEYFKDASDRIKVTLTEQYRMHSDIMEIINVFYDGKLSCGIENEYETRNHGLVIPTVRREEMIVPRRHAYWMDSSEYRGRHYYEQRESGSSSLKNPLEAIMTVEMLKKIDRQYSQMKRTATVGVISFYMDQVKLISSFISQTEFRALCIEVNTVDAFQGKEKDIIIASLVRNRKNPEKISSNSFITSFQRINVAFSRAKNLLLIIGAADTYGMLDVCMRTDGTGARRVYDEIISRLKQSKSFFTADDILQISPTAFPGDEPLSGRGKR